MQTSVRRKYTSWMALLALLYTMGVFPIVQMLEAAMKGMGRDGGSYHSLFSYLLIVFMSMGLVALLKRGFHAEDLGFDVGLQRKVWGLALGGALGFNLVVAAIQAAVPALQEASEQVFQSLKLGEQPVNDWVLLITVGILAPLWEELVFRGFLYRAIQEGLEKRLGRGLAEGAALLVSSLLFMDAHGGEGQEQQRFLLFFFALLLALSYRYTKSLLTPLLFHSLNNTYVLARYFIRAEITGLPFYVLLASPVLLIGIFYCLRGFYQRVSRAAP